MAASRRMLQRQRLQAGELLWMQQPNSNKANTTIVAASSTQVDIGQNAG
jgi:hypothetical protein